jgi:DNA repair photolyase
MNQMKVKEIVCKTALSKSTLPGITYSLNPYRGCEHRCAYCYVPNVLKIKRDTWGTVVEIKRNIPLILSKELKKKKPGVVGISTVTDPYQPVEKRYELTKACLKQLLKVDFPVSVQTKSSLVMRDIDILSQLSHAEVMMSIATLDDNERKILEPFSSPISERLEVLRYCAKNNIRTTVFFGPIYPTIQREEISEIIDIFIEYGASAVWIDSLHLKSDVLENIQKSFANDIKQAAAFSLRKVQKQVYYRDLRDEILKQGKKKNIKIVDAF